MATPAATWKGWKKPDNVAGSSAPAIMVGLFVSTYAEDVMQRGRHVLAGGVHLVPGARQLLSPRFLHTCADTRYRSQLVGFCLDMIQGELDKRLGYDDWH